MTKQIMFPEVRIELGRETRHHPKLLELLSTYDPNEFEMQVAEIASYCDVMVHGDYLSQEVDHLCKILIEKLKAKRQIIILPDSVKVH